MELSSLLKLLWIFPLAYLIGSIPTAVWIGKAIHNIDVREHGSGNAGATNVMRVLGVKTGIPVLLLDMLKGWFSVYLIHFQYEIAKDTETWILISIALGALAVLGHIFPIFAGFRGGKGVATIAGVCFSLHPLATLSAFGIFILVLLITQYVSLGSILAGISFPLWVIFVYQSPFISLYVFAILASILLVLTHRANIGRLLHRKENKASFLFRKKD